MSKTGIQIVLLAAVATIGLALAGCQSTQRTDKAAKSNAVMCEKCQTVWVQTERTFGVNYATVYLSEPVKKCDVCEMAAEEYFRTGKMMTNCPGCGGGLERCAMK